MKEKKSKIVPSHGGNTGIAIIPADIVKDSSFPFELPAQVIVKIDGNRLLIEKAEKRPLALH
jgi:RNase P/RNase MRP subunit p29